jgi:preprotein translocase subunit YajC
MTVNDFVSTLETVSLVLAVGALIVLIYFIASRAVKRQAQR